MSIVPKESIEVIAQSIGVANLAPDVLPGIASDVEFRLRQIIQEAVKCMRHSKRTTLTSNDVESASKLRNLEPIYGFASGDSLRFKRAAGQKDLFYVDDKNVEFKEVIEIPLTKAPQESTVLAHWLAIEGVQPAIPENVPIEALAVPFDQKKDINEEGVSEEIKSPIKYSLSTELRLYFDKITALAVTKSSSITFKEALMSLAVDAGLHPLVPHFTHFIADKVSRNLNNFSLLFALMRFAGSLLRNPHLHIEPYLNQLLPSVMTCLVGKRLGNKYSDNHWELRNFSANLVASVCKRFGHAYHNLQSRVTRTLIHGFLDPTKALPQHYGAIQSLATLGPRVVHLLVLPNLKLYLQLLSPEMEFDTQKNKMKRHEAWRVYGALLCAANRCMYELLRMFPSVLRSSVPVFKRNAKVITTSKKRKAVTDNTMLHPPPKKLATERQMGVISRDPQVAIGGFPASLSGTNVSLPSTSRQPQPPMNGSKFRIQRGGKEDKELGHLVPLLLDCFGESTLSFVPMPELSLFL